MLAQRLPAGGDGAGDLHAEIALFQVVWSMPGGGAGVPPGGGGPGGGPCGAGPLGGDAGTPWLARHRS